MEVVPECPRQCWTWSSLGCTGQRLFMGTAALRVKCSQGVCAKAGGKAQQRLGLGEGSKPRCPWRNLWWVLPARLIAPNNWHTSKTLSLSHCWKQKVAQSQSWTWLVLR